MRPMTQKGIHRLSDKSDALSYSAFHTNLALTVDQVLCNSWGEIICNHFSGENALIDCLVNYMRQIPPDGSLPLPRLDVRCFCPSRASSIASRVEELFRDIIACYYSGTRAIQTRYILEIEQYTYLLQFRRNTPFVRALRSHKELLDVLSEPQPLYSPIVLDRNALEKHPLRVISKLAQPGRVQVFFQRNTDSTDIYVHDEKGSLFHTQKQHIDEDTLLSPVRLSLQNIQYRRAAQQQQSPPIQQTIAYYEIRRNNRGELSSERKPGLDATADRPYHQVQAIAQAGTF